MATPVTDIRRQSPRRCCHMPRNNGKNSAQRPLCDGNTWRWIYAQDAQLWTCAIPFRDEIDSFRLHKSYLGKNSECLFWVDLSRSGDRDYAVKCEKNWWSCWRDYATNYIAKHRSYCVLNRCQLRQLILSPLSFSAIGFLCSAKNGKG